MYTEHDLNTCKQQTLKDINLLTCKASFCKIHKNHPKNTVKSMHKLANEANLYTDTLRCEQVLNGS